MKTFFKTQLINISVLLCSVLLIGCSDSDEQFQDLKSPSIIGVWETYKIEQVVIRQKAISFNPLKLDYSLSWFDMTGPRTSFLKYEFRDDNKFNLYYGEVVALEGEWNRIDENTIVLNFGPSSEETIKTLTFYCDNTISMEYILPPGGKHQFQDSDFKVIEYFKRPSTVVCHEKINYKTNQ